jgi:hypothetical protein
MRHLMMAVLVCVLLAGTCFADVAIGYFDLLNGSPMSSGGEVYLSLNANGTIAASLFSYWGDIEAFGMTSTGSTPLVESNFSQVTPVSELGEPNLFGYGAKKTGFQCPSTPTYCGTSESWTIGTAGEFTSVFQSVISNQTTFVMDTPVGWWAADPVPMPEPSSVLPVGIIIGSIGLVTLFRRKRSA